MIKESSEKTINNLCQEWADDHTHLQNLCRAVGYDEHAVEGDSCGIRSISELADMLHAKTLTVQRAALSVASEWRLEASKHRVSCRLHEAQNDRQRADRHYQRALDLDACAKRIEDLANDQAHL